MAQGPVTRPHPQKDPFTFQEPELTLQPTRPTAQKAV
jgi:hypothetical protein